jgi:hypothetical protein
MHWYALLALIFTKSTIVAQGLPPIRPLGPVLNTSTEPLAAVSQVRALLNGRVIVNDNTGRRVLMFDSTFKTFTVIADSTSATGNAYSSQLGGLVAYSGDSTLFVDPASLSMLVISPAGKIVRTMAAPPPNDIQNLIGGPFGTPGLDARGRLVYRIAVASPRGGMTIGPDGMPQAPSRPDSALIVRFDFATRALDTVIKIGIPKIKLTITRDGDNVSLLTVVNPMSWTDDWALLSDGTIAVVRGHDYRVDFIGPDGQRRSTPKLDFDWYRMTDADKVAVIDSARNALEKQRALMLARMQSRVDPNAKTDTGSTGARQRPQGDGSTMASVGGRGGGGGLPPSGFVPPAPQISTVDELPDYRPAFKQGAVRGDADGNLWVRTSTVVNGGTVYDVINKRGELIDRVLVPPGRTIVGFGVGGVVYMGVLDGDISRLERARYSRAVRL